MTTYVLKRIQKEIKVDWDNNTTNLIFYNHFHDGICNFIVWENFLDFHHPIIQLSINFNNSRYPFTPPKTVIVNNLNYLDMVKYNSNSHKDLERISGQKCLCCNSLLCRKNWNVHKSILDIVTEVIENIKLKQRIIEIIHARKITHIHFGTYIPIMEFL